MNRRALDGRSEKRSRAENGSQFSTPREIRRESTVHTWESLPGGVLVFLRVTEHLDEALHDRRIELRSCTLLQLRQGFLWRTPNVVEKRPLYEVIGLRHRNDAC